MKNSISIKIEAWKKKHGLTSKPKYIPLLKSFRRVHMFHKGNVNDSLIFLGYPSEVKEVKEYLAPHRGKETPRILNWYSLTDKGKELVSELFQSIGWNEDEMNAEIFNL